MKYIKLYESEKNKTTYYKIPVYPLDKYLVAITKVGMTPSQLETWKNNSQAAYWNSKYYKYIFLIHQYHSYDKRYHWVWTKGTFEEDTKDIITIEVTEEELAANKYNL